MNFSPTFISLLAGETATLFTTLFFAGTFTVMVALAFPSTALMVILAVPAFFALILPFLSTVATLFLLLLKVSFLFATPEGSNFVFKVRVFPIRTATVLLTELLTVIFLITSFTVILQVAFALLLLFDVTVMVAVPFFLATIWPLELTVATFLLLVLNFTLLDAFFGVTLFTFSVYFSPTLMVFFLADSVILVGFAAAWAVCGTASTVVTTSISVSARVNTLVIGCFLITFLLVFLYYELCAYNSYYGNLARRRAFSLWRRTELPDCPFTHKLGSVPAN